MGFNMDPNVLYNAADSLDNALRTYNEHLGELSLMLQKISNSPEWIEAGVKDEFLNTFTQMLNYNYALYESYINMSVAFKRLALSVDNNRKRFK